MKSSTGIRALALLLVLASFACRDNGPGPWATFHFVVSQPGSPVPATTQARLTLAHPSEAIAADTTFVIMGPAVAMSVRFRLLPNPPASGEEMKLTLRYMNSAGNVVWVAGPTIVAIKPEGSA